MAARTVDLRSDTVTKPTDEMREAMVQAIVGDDSFGEDPTVNELQDRAAAKVGMEAALYVPSGTMANRCALVAHTRPGDAVFCEEEAHMYLGERKGYVNIASLAPRTIKGESGIIKPEQVDEAVESSNALVARPSLLCLENTHNMSGGTAWLPEEIEATAAAAHRHGLKVHIDGARIFNAVAAIGVDVQEYTRHADSVMFCVSKGLSAPVGSLLCGSRDMIERARAMRKRLGGGMRQAGMVAAAGIVALETMVERLAEDNARAKKLYEGLSAIEGIEAAQPFRPTNFVLVDVAGMGWQHDEMFEKWKSCGILGHPRPPTALRLVVNRHIDDEDVDYVVSETQRLIAAAR